MRRILLLLMLACPALGFSQAQIKIDTIQGVSAPFITSATSEVDFYNTIVKNYSTASAFSDTLRIYVAVVDALGQPQLMTIVDVGYRTMDTLGSANDTINIDTTTVNVNPSFFLEGNNTVVIWPASSGTYTIDTFYVEGVLFVSVNELIANSIDVTMGPNPASDHIVLGDPDHVVKEVRIRNLEGKLMGTGHTNAIIGLHGLREGMYLVELVTERDIFSRKLIIRR